LLLPKPESKSTTALLRKFAKSAKPLFPAEFKVVVAVSGGADSIALMHLLARSNLLPQNEICQKLLVAHFNHDLRHESADEASFVQKAAYDLGIKSVVGVWSKKSTNGNLAAKAREARYKFLTNTAQKFVANCLVTGHHQDDQAETFLDRLIRGSGLTGLKAMEASRKLETNPPILLVRPMLNMSREIIHSWLREQNIGWREDPTNKNTDYRRAFMRHEILPSLQKLEPHTKQRIAAATLRIAQAQTALEWSLQQNWSTLELNQINNELSISQEALTALPDELVVLALRRCHKMVTKLDHPPSNKAVEEFIHLARSRRKKGEIRIRGVKILKADKRLIFSPQTNSTH
jgi:tRNA(Ile)-lysidine synthase